MANTIIPPINTFGTWKVKLPYTVNTDTPYWLIAIRMFEDITKAGIDVYKTYYLPFGLKDGELIPGTSTPFNFNDEIKNGARILTLKSEAGQILYIPSTFIDDYPDTGVVLYRPMIVSINLGLFQDGMDYSILLQALEETCKQYVGVDTVTTAIHAAPVTKGLTVDQMEAIETARRNKMSSQPTNIERVIALEAENAQLRDTNTKAMKILQDNDLLN